MEVGVCVRVHMCVCGLDGGSVVECGASFSVGSANGNGSNPRQCECSPGILVSESITLKT